MSVLKLLDEECVVEFKREDDEGTVTVIGGDDEFGYELTAAQIRELAEELAAMADDLEGA